jgi:hypothetical protein
MRRQRLLAWVSIAALSCFGCAHTEQTGSGKARDGVDDQPQNVAAPTRAPRAITPKTEAGHPPLAASPDELMRPDSVEKITKALTAKGFLAKEPTPTEFLDAIKAFQRSRNLAATGFADHETLMRLGIDPKDVDKSLGTPDVKAAEANGTGPQKKQ